MEWVQILAGPIFMVIGGIVAWIVRSRTEELRAMREKLREEQRKIYSQILDPCWLKDSESLSSDTGNYIV